MAATKTTPNPTLPNGFDPADYRHVGCFYRGSSDDMYEAYAPEHLLLDRQFPGWADEYRRHANGGCVLCGALYAHGFLFRHNETGELIGIGHTCGADFDVDDALAFRQRKAVRAVEAQNAERKQRVIRAEVFAEQLAEDPALVDAFETDHDIVRDILSKGWKYGGVTERQAALVLKIARDEANAAPKALPKIPVPGIGERRQIEGTVISVKEKMNYYGDFVFKMVVEVETETGTFRLYGTRPRALRRAERGDRIRFTAKVENADWSDDESFGTFSRPSKAEFLD